MNKVQVLKCKCGSIRAACKEPECYEDAEWHKDMRAYLKKGYTVELVDSGTWKFEKCKCNNKLFED